MLGFSNVVAATNILTINTFRCLMSEWFLNLKIIVTLNFTGHRKIMLRVGMKTHNGLLHKH